MILELNVIDQCRFCRRKFSGDEGVGVTAKTKSGQEIIWAHEQCLKTHRRRRKRRKAKLKRQQSYAKVRAKID
jgi:hypothetical protein